ncbi:peptidase [Marispirochaeta aestuarii]|uniref:Peptidase n=1 Tax=Marispirochaeta aestuarii TaxID=1963862 RepID=A0A1Y1S0L6_9SPIO|nr:AbrB/MazE/SpoVT family DNA-binding domain-containing protein [Marispirochaeta aestuarii]ORC35914.1 peptidase [Marispirochaeta aestuarii]
MIISVIPIGNSKGIRIPKGILKQLEIDEKVELEVRDKEILIKPVKTRPREGWEEAFTEMHKNGDDALMFPEILDQESFEWEW